jgi:hypothetical protein
MAFKRQVPISRKIVINNIKLEQIHTFTCLGCKISYEEKKNIASKISTFLQILGTLNSVLKPHSVQRQSRLKVYILVIPLLLYGYEIGH